MKISRKTASLLVSSVAWRAKLAGNELAGIRAEHLQGQRE